EVVVQRGNEGRVAGQRGGRVHLHVGQAGCRVAERRRAAEQVVFGRNGQGRSGVLPLHHDGALRAGGGADAAEVVVPQAAAQDEVGRGAAEVQERVRRGGPGVDEAPNADLAVVRVVPLRRGVQRRVGGAGGKDHDPRRAGATTTDLVVRQDGPFQRAD